MGEEGILGDEAEIGLNKLQIDFPLEVSLTESINWKMSPVEVPSLTEKQMEMVTKGIRKAKLKLNDITNDIEVELNVNLYLANIPNARQMDTKDVKTELFNKEVFREISLSQGSNQDRGLVLTKKEAHIFTNDNLYFGIKLTIPKTGDNETYSIKSGDIFEIGKVYSTITAKVNQ